jgi:hypothetical protein
MDAHPIQLLSRDDLARTRLTVLFRIILWIPHGIWLYLWGIAVGIAVIVSWFATLIAGETPKGLHDFIARYYRYQTQALAYLFLLSDPYPGFLGDQPYSIDAGIAPPAPQNRWITAFRIILAIPVILVSWVLNYLEGLIALIAWFVCLVTASMPRGLESIGTWILRFHLQTSAYISLLTDRYPAFAVEPTPQAGTQT